MSTRARVHELREADGPPSPRSIHRLRGAPALRRLAWMIGLGHALTACAGRGEPPPRPGTISGPGEEKALALLASEVPGWPAENDCFSCHHNGDAARVLFTAKRLGREIAPGAAATTLAWLEAPRGWDHQKGDPSFSDRTLSRLQFSAALAAALEAGLIDRRDVAASAGELAAGLQGADGSWTIEPADTLGSPATWGTHLATASTRRALETFDAARFREPIARARAWLISAPCRNVIEAAAILIGLAGDAGEDAVPRREACLREVEAARSARGAWGPYREVPPEVFDTALVLIAVSPLPRTPAIDDWIRGGRRFLLAAQEDDGGWPATTRPRGGVSYAQSTSTTAWATLALLLTYAP